MTYAPMDTVAVEMEEYDVSGSIFSEIEGATTQFWGEHGLGRYDYQYSDGLLCPLCGMEGIKTRINNGSKLCYRHRNIVIGKTHRDVARFKRYAAKHSERWRAYLEEHPDAL